MIKHTCPVCGIKVKLNGNGRPRVYCSDRCKEKSKRRREREAERESFLQVSPGFGGAPSAPLCHVCSARPASVGTPSPLLCSGCATPP